MTFTQIFNEFIVAPLTQAAVKACLPIDATLEQAVLHYFVVKHSIEYDIREMAIIVALYLREFRNKGVHEATKALLRETDLRYNKKYGVGYPHADGSYHWFWVVKDEPKEASTGSYPHIEKMMKGFDWYYGFSDDYRVLNEWRAKRKELIQACKDAGLTEKEMQDLKKKYEDGPHSCRLTY